MCCCYLLRPSNALPSSPFQSAAIQASDAVQQLLVILKKVTYKPAGVECIVCTKRTPADKLCANQTCGHLSMCHGCGRTSDAYSLQCSLCRSNPAADDKDLCHSIECVYNFLLYLIYSPLTYALFRRLEDPDLFEEGGIRCTGCKVIMYGKKMTGFDACYHRFCPKCMPRKPETAAKERSITCVGCKVRQVGADGKAAYTCMSPDCMSDVAHVIFAPSKGDVLPETFGLDPLP